ncbi:MAG: NAD(P)-dependent oxidoreductase [Betaproteobacteria bacterium]|nr:NAD(P)-dependent oxidoreductase [Betaproteobacteria bacterium]
MTDERQPVGVIGTGLMGTACAKRLLGAGFAVMGYDVHAGKLKQLEALGAGVARSISEIARGCGQVVVTVFNTEQVEDVFEGRDGLLAARPKGSAPLVALCVSTCDPDRIAALAARLAAGRLRFVESPISGTSEQTANGEGLGLIGGERAAVDEAREVLDAICPRRRYLGAAGNGGRTKLAINLILGINRAALAEGLVFAERMGLDPAAFLAVARESAAYSQIMDVKGAKMLAGDFTPHGHVTQSLKDFSLITEQAARLKQRLPLGETYGELMKGCIAHGEGELDNSAVIREIRRRTLDNA